MLKSDMKNRKNPFPLLRLSTRAYLREARQTQGYTFFDLLHAYVYSRWPYLYIGIGTGENKFGKVIKPLVYGIGKILAVTKKDKAVSKKRFGKQFNQNVTFAETYHGKVVSLKAAEKLVTLDHKIELKDLEKVIPYQTARDIILKHPDHIVVLECPCRKIRKNPCLPLDVCLIIGEPFAGFVAEHHPSRSRWISSKEAIQILRQEHERGHVHHAFFKDAMFGRFYAICNCCSCCCGAMQAHQNGIPMLASSGFIVNWDKANCENCGDCSRFCPFGAINHNNDGPICQLDLCMGCGICVSLCKNKALFLQRDKTKSEPLEIGELLKN
jgi:Pyruvate/2-oxoacid:ferredoxin oxidoreductase delta subunit